MLRTLLVAFAILCLAPLVPREGAGQEPGPESPGIPDHVARQAVEFFNDSATTRISGRAHIAPDRRFDGDVAVAGGSLVLAGEIRGDLLVLNGNLVFEEGGRVTGDVGVVGGGVRNAEAGSVGGTLTVHPERLRFTQVGDRIRLAPEERGSFRSFSTPLGLGQARITVRAGTNYNRVEGLPVMIGPVVETTDSSPLLFQILGIWKTDSGLNLSTDELGYSILLEQRLGGQGLHSVGATAHSVVQPMEEWTLTDVESSLASFFFRKDFRDYYDRTGWSLFARTRLPDAPLSLKLEYRDERHRFAPVGGPWSLQDNDEPWRPQPLVAEGRLRALGTTVTLDTRNDPDDPTTGWLVRASGHLGVGGDLALPAHRPLLAEPDEEAAGPLPEVPSAGVDPHFARGFLDLRRYDRVGPSSELALRGVLGGSLDGDPLPPQFQHALGGEGSLPGIRLFSADCGARSRAVTFLPDPQGSPGGETAFPAYGCDRMALFQAEYRGSFLGRWGLGPGEGAEDRELAPLLEFRPRWAAFLNAGRGWSLAPPGADTPPRTHTRTHLDLGAGVYLGKIGLYVALPVTGENRQPNFFVRLDRRF